MNEPWELIEWFEKSLVKFVNNIILEGLTHPTGKLRVSVRFDYLTDICRDEYGGEC